MKELIRFLRIKIFHCIIHLRHTQNIPYPSGATMVIAPHPDDEVLGCSGLITRLLHEKKEIHVVILSNGAGSHNGCCQVSHEELTKKRKTLAIRAASILGLSTEKLHLLNYPDGGIRYDHTATEKLKELIYKIQPETIFVPHQKEGWSDHIEAGTIIKMLTAKSPAIHLYEYCVWFWYYNSWKINWGNTYLLRMNQSEHQIKNRAIDNYILPIAPCGKPWSGVLPKVLVKANQWKNELYFKIK